MKYISFSKLPVLLLAIGLLFLSSCADDGVVELNQQTLILPQSQELINATINGLVIDESGTPISGATVSLISGLVPLEVITDEYGVFTMENADSRGGSAYISVKFPGKFEGFRKFSIVPKKYNYTEVMLMDRTVVGTIDAAQGGTLTEANGASVTLPTGGIINAQNTAYTGAVSVAMTWIDPSAEDLATRMIGDLSGINLDGEYQSLGSFGMLQVELTDANGNELNIAEGEEAQLVFPIPTSLLNDAPSTIPLWSYNEKIGTWVQEGFANKEGNKYIGEVSHFSSWNVDIMTDPISIEGKVVVSTEAGVEFGASYLQVYVCSDVFGKKGGWLCDDGSFEFYNFPKGESFKLKVYDKCGQEIFRETFGPFEEDKNLGNLSVAATNDSFIRVKGNAVDCNGIALEGAQLSVLQADRRENFPIDDMGEFDFTINTCGGDNSILQIVNPDDLLTIKETISSGQEVVEFVDLKVCEELESFITVTPEGGETIIYTPDVMASLLPIDSSGELGNRVGLFFDSGQLIDDPGGQKTIILVFDVDPITNEAIGEFILYGDKNMACSAQNLNDEMKVTLTSFGKEVGDVIEGTFRVENVECTDFPTEEKTIISVVEGSFSVPIEESL